MLAPAETLARYPSLGIVLVAVFVLAGALLARGLMRTVGLPSIITLMLWGLLAGPSGLHLMTLDLTQPALRALLSLCVVIVLFEATLRMDLSNLPKRTLMLLVSVGPALVLALVPLTGRLHGLDATVAWLVAAVCIVTGPTVTGPLLVRLRLRTSLSHVLETVGLMLDALGVVVAAATFTFLTSRGDTTLATALRSATVVGTGIAVGIVTGVVAQRLLPLVLRLPSDIVKLGVLFTGLLAYAVSEFLAHESGLAAVVACGLVLDLSRLPQQRLLRTFKEDISTLALSTVFVLLASQIKLAAMRDALQAGLWILLALLAVRVATVAVATVRSPYGWRERMMMVTMMPRGIVAVSLATYYSTQMSAWGVRGGNLLAGTLFVVVMGSVIFSGAAGAAIATLMRLRQPSVVVAGISSQSVEIAETLRDLGYVVHLVDEDERRVEFARSHDLSASVWEPHWRLRDAVREHRARLLLIGRPHVWIDSLRAGLPVRVRLLATEPLDRVDAVVLPDASRESVRRALEGEPGEPGAVETQGGAPSAEELGPVVPVTGAPAAALAAESPVRDRGSA